MLYKAINRQQQQKEQKGQKEPKEQPRFNRINNDRGAKKRGGASRKTSVKINENGKNNANFRQQ